MAGMLIQKNIICDKTDKRNRELENLKDAIRRVMNTLRMAETDMLEGEAWDSVRCFVDEVLEPIIIYFTCYIDTQIEENRKYKQQAAILPNSVMDEDHLHSLIRDCEEAIRKAKNSIPPRLSKISHLSAKIAIYNAQLSAMYAFVSITLPYYEMVKLYQEKLDQVSVELAKSVFNAGQGVIDYSMVNEEFLKALGEEGAKKLLLDYGITELEMQQAEAEGYDLICQIKCIEEMKQKQVHIEEINGMKELGYEYSDIIGIWGSLTEKEKPFMANIIIGTEDSYKTAFRTDPNDLFGYGSSGNIPSFLVEYSCNLLGDKRLEHFTNGIFSATVAYDEQIVDMTGSISYRQTGLTYWDVYLDVLSAKTQYMLEGTTTKCVDGEGDDDKYSQLRHMYNYWSTIRQRTAGRHDEFGNVDFSIKLHHQPEAGNKKFVCDLMYYSPQEKENIKENITMTLMDNEQLEREFSNQLIEEMKREIKELRQKHVLNFAISGVGVTALGAKTSNRVGIVTSAGLEIASYYDDKRELEKEIDWQNLKKELRTLGAGGKYIVTIESENKTKEAITEVHISYVGFYHIDNMRTAKLIEKGGIKLAKGLSEDECDAIRNGIIADAGKAYNINKADFQKMAEDAINLLEEGYPMLKKEIVNGQEVYRFRDYSAYEATMDFLSGYCDVDDKESGLSSLEDKLW